MVSISYAGLASFLSEVFRVTFFVYDLIIEGVLVLFLEGVSWPCANPLIATSVVKAFLHGTMAILTILMSRGLNNMPTTQTTKTFQDVLAMIRPTCALVVVLVS